MKLAGSFPYGMARLGINTPLSMKEKSYEKTIVKLSWLAMRLRPCVRVRQSRAFRCTCHAADELQIHSIEKSAQEAWPSAAAETQPLTNQRQTKGVLAIPLYEISLAEDGAALAVLPGRPALPPMLTASFFTRAAMQVDAVAVLSSCFPAKAPPGRPSPFPPLTAKSL